MPKLNVHLGNGILIGMGIILVILGFFGWFSAGYLYRTFSSTLEEAGLDPSRHFIFRELERLISDYMVFIVAGFASLIFGVLFERKRIISNTWAGIPHGRLIGGLWGSGGAFALSSLGFLFRYLLSSDYFYLDFFIVFETIGILLIALGIIIYTRR